MSRMRSKTLVTQSIKPHFDTKDKKGVENQSVESDDAIGKFCFILLKYEQSKVSSLKHLCLFNYTLYRNWWFIEFLYFT